MVNSGKDRDLGRERAANPAPCRGSWATRGRKSASISRRYDISGRDCDRSDSGISPKSRRSHVQRLPRSPAPPFSGRTRKSNHNNYEKNICTLLRKSAPLVSAFRGTSLQQLIDRFSEIPDRARESCQTASTPAHTFMASQGCAIVVAIRRAAYTRNPRRGKAAPSRRGR